MKSIIYKHTYPAFFKNQDGNLMGLKWPLLALVLKKLAQVLDKIILSQCEKFHCLTLCTYRGDSGTNKDRTYPVLYNTSRTRSILNGKRSVRSPPILCDALRSDKHY